MQTPIFRLATLNDLPQLVELRMLMQNEVNSLSAIESCPDYKASVTDYFERSIQNESYLSAVAEIGGRLVSANGLVIYCKPPSVIGGTGQVGYVTNVYTRPEWRRQGIAGELMKLLVEQARLRGLDKLHLGATESGKNVYKQVGFKSPRFAPLELKL